MGEQRVERGSSREGRRLPLGVRVRYAIAILVALIAAYGAWQAYTTSEDLKANVLNQVQNRTVNVATWCGAIDAGRDYDRAFIAAVTRGELTYTLGDLDCSAIEAKTLASTRPHHAAAK